MRRMNSQELKKKVDLLIERRVKLRDGYWKLEKNAQIERCKSYGEAICECLPILGTAREERNTVWTLLNAISFLFGLEPPEWRQTFQTIVDSLNRFAVRYEHWQKVETYAREKTTVDFELHAMAVRARKIVFYIEKKPVEKKDYNLWPPTTSEPFIVSVQYYGSSSAFGLTQGVHFFETLVLIHPNCGSNQEFQIGWNTRRRLFGKWSERHPIDEENLLECTYDSIDDDHFIGFKSSFPFGTVLGCLLVATQRSFTFYVNGQELKFTKEFSLSSKPYYVLASGDLLYCNFGQVPFKYPPLGLLAACPATDLSKQANKYALYKDFELMPLFDNQVEPYFTDEKQRKLKQTFSQLWAKGEIPKERFEEKYEQLRQEESFHRETYDWRWLQAILENEYVADRSINKWASLVEMMVAFCKDEKTDSLYDFLVPYTKLRQTVDSKSPRDRTKTRTLAILFATLLKYKGHSRVYSHISSLFSFLLAAFLTTRDPSTAMFTLIGLEVDQENRMQELASNEFTKRLQHWKRTKFSYIWNHILLHPEARYTLPQLNLVIHHFENSLKSSALPPATATSLSPTECSSQGKLSSDCLSFRSDFQWQSARSHLSVDNSLSLAFPLFYFEVTLLTSGPMRIGWASQNGLVKSDILGDTILSIGYDGSTGCIWHQDLQWRLSNAKKWKAGDVIGCLLDLTLDKEKFTFYQNGEKIETNGDIYSRVSKLDFRLKSAIVYERNVYDSVEPMTPFVYMHPYQAALSLGPYQQVTVNFGSTPFCYLPKRLNVWNFHNYSEHFLKQRQGSGTVFNIGNANNAVIAVKSKLTAETISMNSTTGPPQGSSDNAEKATFCDLCQEETGLLLQTVGCTHSFRFCQPCSVKNISCGKCKRQTMN